MNTAVPAFMKELICKVLGLLVPLLELNRFEILLGELEEGQVASSGWPFVSEVPGQMTHLIASLTLDSARSTTLPIGNFLSCSKQLDDLRKSLSSSELRECYLCTLCMRYEEYSDILFEVPHYDTYLDSDVLNSNIQELGYIENIVSTNESYDELKGNGDVISYADYMLIIRDDADNYVPPPVQKDDMMLSVIEQMKYQVEKCTKVLKNLNKARDLLTKFDECIKRRTTLSPHEIGSWEQSDKKDAFKKDVIPFSKNLKETCKLFEKGFITEVKEMKDIFKQMEDEVDHFTQKMKTRIQKIKYENMSLTFQVSSLVKEREHIKLEYKKLYDSINQTRAKTKLQTDSLQQKLNDQISKNDKLRAQLKGKLSESQTNHNGTSVTKLSKPSTSGTKLYIVTLFPKSKVIPKVVKKNDLSKSVTSHLTTNKIIKKCTKVLTPSLLKIETEPINEYFKKNRVVHHDYLRVTKEHVATLQELLELARALKPFDEHIGYASKFAAQIQELTITKEHAVKQNTRKTDNTMLPSTGRVSSTNASGSKLRGNTKNDRIPQPSSRSMKNKVEAHHRKFKSSANKNNHVSDCNANVKNVALSKNYDTICLSCNEYLFSTNHDACVVQYLKKMEKRKVAKSAKQKIKREWKPTRRIFKTICLNWIPTGRTFNLIIEIILWYLDSGCSKHMTGRRDKLINFVFKFIKFYQNDSVSGNDQFCSYYGYGDLQMENILISRVYYVEGLGQ
ncbi:hypothetical protein Tco_0323632 [Tanacetum coccineum]